MPEIARVEDLAAIVANLERRVADMETAARMKNASQKGGAFRILDALTGDERVRLGLLDDGSYGLNVSAGRLTVEGATVDAISASVGGANAVNFTLNTTPSVVVQHSLTKPTWATRALCFSVGYLQHTNSSGVIRTIFNRTDIGSLGSGANSMSIPNLSIGGNNHFTTSIISGGSLGSSVDFFHVGSIDVGSTTATLATIRSIAIWMRV